MTSNKKQLTYERLHELLDYNPKTGVFVWKVRRRGTAVAGSVAGWVTPGGYRRIGIDGKFYLAHRLAWFYFYGYMPENFLDHINRVRDDNRICNLREVSHQCNLRNSKRACNNTSGVCGVHWNKACGKWQAYIALNNKLYHFGIFEDLDEAVCYRLAAEECLGWSGCNSTSDAFRYVQKNIVGRNS